MLFTLKGSRGCLFFANEADKNAKVSGGHARNLFFTKESHPLFRRWCLLASDLLATSAHGFCPTLQVFCYVFSSSLALRYNSVLCILLASLLRSVTIGSLRPFRFSLALRHSRPLCVLLASLLHSVTIVLSLSFSLLFCASSQSCSLHYRQGPVVHSVLGGAILVYGFQVPHLCCSYRWIHDLVAVSGVFT